MSKKFAVTEIDKVERIKKHDQKKKSKVREKTKEEGFEKKIIKTKRDNKNGWLKNYDAYNDEEEEDFNEYEF